MEPVLKSQARSISSVTQHVFFQMLKKKISDHFPLDTYKRQRLQRTTCYGLDVPQAARYKQPGCSLFDITSKNHHHGNDHYRQKPVRKDCLCSTQQQFLSSYFYVIPTDDTIICCWLASSCFLRRLVLLVYALY